MKEYPNRFSKYLEQPEIERLVVGGKVDKVDNLKVKEYGGTHYIYEEKDNG